jgi:hypothetical protein
MKRKSFLIFRAICRGLLWAGIIALFYLLVTHVNYTEGGYCFGSIEKCYGEGL